MIFFNKLHYSMFKIDRNGACSNTTINYNHDTQTNNTKSLFKNASRNNILRL